MRESLPLTLPAHRSPCVRRAQVDSSRGQHQAQVSKLQAQVEALQKEKKSLGDKVRGPSPAQGCSAAQ